MDPALLKLETAELELAHLYALFRQFKSPKDKITYLIKKGDLIPIKRGIYILAPEYGKLVSTKILANMLYFPSYISLQSALRYYALIPESSWGENSVSTKRSKTFNTALGEFSYHSSNLEDYSWGQHSQALQDGRLFRAATPIKSLYDLLRFSLKKKHQMQTAYIHEYLEALRLDMDAAIWKSQELEMLKHAKKKQIAITLKQWLQTQINGNDDEH